MQKSQPFLNKAAFHLLLEGQVQGVGFRPYVWHLATEYCLTGWVSNSIDGVHIEIEGNEKICREFCRTVLRLIPGSARITRYSILETGIKGFTDFQIRESENQGTPNLLITPDLGLCDACKADILDSNNKRFHYAFTTCTNCGPRYSIIQAVPYDRVNTTMIEFHQCPSCQKEYADVTDRRFFSQTNSCPDCAILLSLVDNEGNCLSEDTNEIVSRAAQLLSEGKIIAMKGIGGYLLLCDATHAEVIQTLRERKHRPTKPFALLYPSLQLLQQDAYLSEAEEEALTNSEAPIVLLLTKPDSSLVLKAIAPHLNQIGAMLPYTPLMVLLANAFGKPMVATSGNESGSPIFYRDEEAMENLGAIADYFILNNREITMPQDDSVIRFTLDDQRLVMRRSRGMAPTFLPHPFSKETGSVLAMGSDLKSTFAWLHQKNVYASQYLGDLENFKTQQNFQHAIEHWFNLMNARPEIVLLDKHPAFFSSDLGRKLASKADLPVQRIQHHEAHFAAVLAENDLLETEENILGVIWDGTGWGADNNVWGGEFFTYKSGEFDRVAHLDYFDHVLGDKFSREPRLCALSLFRNIEGAEPLLKYKFTQTEWELYNNMLDNQSHVKTSSIGRLFDGVASLLGLCDKATYEGEAALYLETLASKAVLSEAHWGIAKSQSLQASMQNMVEDIWYRTSREVIAWQFHLSLVNWISKVAARQRVKTIAFSGGVFQNALLVHLIQDQLSDRYELKFHKQLSPNDECIGIGQLAWYYIQKHVKPVLAENKAELDYSFQLK